MSGAVRRRAGTHGARRAPSRWPIGHDSPPSSPKGQSASYGPTTPTGSPNPQTVTRTRTGEAAPSRHPRPTPWPIDPQITGLKLNS